MPKTKKTRRNVKCLNRSKIAIIFSGTVGACRRRAFARLGIGGWGLEIGDWRLEVGDWRLEIQDLLRFA